MGGLLSSNSRRRRSAQNRRTAKNVQDSSSSSSDASPIKSAKRKNRALGVQDAPKRGGNVKAKTNMFNRIDEEASPSQPAKSHKTSGSKNQDKRFKKREGFDYQIDNRSSNEKVVTVNLDIPTLTSTHQQPKSYHPIAVSSKATGMPTKKEFEAACIKAHNQYRQCHGAGPLERDSKLTSMAQEWANKLAKMGNLHHSNNRGYGENVAFTSKNEPSGRIYSMSVII